METTILTNAKHTYQCPKKWASIVDKNDPEFCTLCQKKVYDLTSRTSAEIDELFELHNGSMCAKLYEDQLDTWEEPASRWKLIAATLAAFFTFNVGKVIAQDVKNEAPVEQIERIYYKYTPNGDAKCVLPKEQIEDFEVEEEVITACDTKAKSTKRRRRYRYKKSIFRSAFRLFISEELCEV